MVGRPKKNTSLDTSAQINNDVSDKQYVLFAKEDTELQRGRIKVATGIMINKECRGVVTNLVDNIRNGFLVNNGIRLEDTEVIPYVVDDGELYVYIKINDSTMYAENLGNGVRMRNVYIPKGTPIAVFTLL